MLEHGHGQFGYTCTYFVICELQQFVHTCVVCHRVSVVVPACTILAHQISCHDVTLVLHGTCCHEYIPHHHACFGPVGTYQNQVIVIAPYVSRPYGEPHIVADEQQDLYALIGEYRTFLAGREESVLASGGIEVPFVGELRSGMG